MALLWRTAAGRERAQVGGPTPLDSCSCGCGCEPDGDWHWSQQPWCRCAVNGCQCVTDEPLKKKASEACECGQTHPTEESVQHILDNYGFEDAYPSGATGREKWEEVKDNNIWDHPVHQEMSRDIATRGILRSIRIDYHRSPPVVTDGHTRLGHAERLGLKTVPVKHGDWWDVHHFPDETQTREV